MSDDERFEWHEIRTLGGGSRFVRGSCRHLNVAPVDSITGESVASLCLDCDAQLPPGWRWTPPNPGVARKHA